ncbi:MAG: PEP-CTERM sorting domain-containing protein [Phycisphaerales bacterium]
MKTMNYCLGVVAVAMCAQGALGAISNLNAGESADLFGITAAEDMSLVGTANDFSQDISIFDAAGNLFEARFQSRAITRFDTGQIDFAWRISGIEDLAGQVASVVVNGHEAWSVGVEYRIDGLGDVGPTSAFRTEDGDSVGFNFDDPAVGFENESKFFFARSDASDFAMTGTARITLVTGQFIDVDTWAPAVPAPGSLALLGLGGLTAMRRRR